MKQKMYSTSVQAGKGTQGKSIKLRYAHTDCDLTFWKHSKSTEVLLKGWSWTIKSAHSHIQRYKFGLDKGETGSMYKELLFSIISVKFTADVRSNAPQAEMFFRHNSAQGWMKI